MKQRKWKKESKERGRRKGRKEKKHDIIPLLASSYVSRPTNFFQIYYNFTQKIF